MCEQVDMKDYVDMRFNNIDGRLESMNEFRGALEDQIATYITREEFCRMEKDVRGLSEFRAAVNSKASQTSVIWAYIVSAVGMAVSILGLLLKTGVIL